MKSLVVMLLLLSSIKVSAIAIPTPTIEEFTRMTIITTSEYVQTLQPLIEWKNQKGIATDLALYPEATGEGREGVKSYIANRYRKDSVTCFLIVGDEHQVPSHIEIILADNDTVVTDNRYTNIEGGEYDISPEAAIGRIPVHTAEEAEIIIDKTVQYEKYPDTSDNWHSRALAVSMTEKVETFHGTWAPANEITDTVLTHFGSDHDDYSFKKFYGDNIDKELFLPRLSEGVGLTYYTGHGADQGWLSCALVNSDAAIITNGYRMPIIISCACYTGRFNTPLGDCMAGAWLKAGEVGSGGGAVAFIGATHALAQNVEPAFYEMARLFSTDKYNSLGTIVNNAKLHYVEMNGTDIPRLMIFGDPSLWPFTSKPTPIPLTYSFSNDSLIISAPEGTVVHIQTKSGSVSETKRLAAPGVSFYLGTGISEDILLTATGKNRYPFIDTLNTSTSIGNKPTLADRETIMVQKGNLLRVQSIGNELFHLRIFSLKGRIIREHHFASSGDYFINLGNLGTASSIVVVKLHTGGREIEQRLCPIIH